MTMTANQHPRMNASFPRPARGLFLLCAAALTLSHLFATSAASLPPGLEDADPAWVQTWEYELERQLEMLESAYNLDADALATARIELNARLLQQKEYEAKMFQELAELSKKAEASGQALEDENSPASLEFADRFIVLTQGMPLADQQVNQWMSERVPPAVAAQGKQRYAELMKRYTLHLQTDQIDSDRYGSHKSSLTRESASLRAEVPTMYDRPTPPGMLEEAEAAELKRQMEPYVEPQRAERRHRVVQTEEGTPEFAPPPVKIQRPVQAPGAAPQQPIAKSEPKPVSPPRPAVKPTPRPAAQQPAQTPPPPPAPPLDEWEKYVLTIAAKYEFDESQTTNARSILSDLRRRAYQYRASRAEDFARAELMTDAKARAEELKHLNRPQDAMFEELKARLESLPTQSQRQKAASPQSK